MAEFRDSCGVVSEGRNFHRPRRPGRPPTANQESQIEGGSRVLASLPNSLTLPVVRATSPLINDRRQPISAEKLGNSDVVNRPRFRDLREFVLMGLRSIDCKVSA